MTDVEERFGTLTDRYERDLRDRYGALLTIDDVAELLRYSSPHAVRQARTRGALPIPMIRLPPRRNWFAPVAGVAEFLARLELEAQASGRAT